MAEYEMIELFVAVVASAAIIGCVIGLVLVFFGKR